jgi:putative tryptophan/tyrosine transport system substrate-binding protein
MNHLRRRIVLGFGAAPFVAIAQVPATAPGTKKRLGVLYFPSRQVIESFPHDYSAYVSFGWIEGRTLEKVKRYADGDAARFEPLARELVAERPDVLLAAGVPCTRAMQKATRTIPICAIVDDPVGNGFAKSMARPGGNITGLCEGYAESSEKEMALLRAAMPGISRLAIVSTSYATRELRANSQWLVKAARSAGISVDVHGIHSPAELEPVIRTLPAGKSALYARWVSGKQAQMIASLATPRRIAVVGQDVELVDHGALMAYSPVVAEDRQLVAMLDRLLRGGNPAEIPFELPTRAIFAINRKAAAAIGVRFPADFNLTADRIVD